MRIPAPIADYAETLTAIRRDLHAHPELGFEEVRTSGVVADKLREYGVDHIETGIGKTGVVAVIKGARPGRRIGLRADMDALPIHEQTNLPYASKNAGIMHACGHDSHTTMLLGAAKYLAETRDFAGEAVLIFQPAEEGLGGARAMLADGLFDRFPVDEVYGLHNSPFDDPGKIGIKPGAAMAGANFFDIKITGRGGHAARPEGTVDALVVAAGLARELHTIVSRNVPPSVPIVLSVTQLHAGAAYNVIPEDATLAGTIRYFNDEVSELVSQRMREICAGYAITHGAEIEIDIRNVFDVLRNDDALSGEMLSAAIDIVGAENARQKDEAVMGSEDFADMLALVPGAYCTIGHAGDVPLHNPAFVLDDDILPLGATLMARMVEARGAA